MSDSGTYCSPAERERASLRLCTCSSVRDMLPFADLMSIVQLIDRDRSGLQTGFDGWHFRPGPCGLVLTRQDLGCLLRSCRAAMSAITTQVECNSTWILDYASGSPLWYGPHTNRRPRHLGRLRSLSLQTVPMDGDTPWIGLLRSSILRELHSLQTLITCRSIPSLVFSYVLHSLPEPGRLTRLQCNIHSASDEVAQKVGASLLHLTITDEFFYEPAWSTVLRCCHRLRELHVSGLHESHLAPHLSTLLAPLSALTSFTIEKKTQMPDISSWAFSPRLPVQRLFPQHVWRTLHMLSWQDSGCQLRQPSTCFADATSLVHLRMDLSGEEVAQQVVAQMPATGSLRSLSLRHTGCFQWQQSSGFCASFLHLPPPPALSRLERLQMQVLFTHADVAGALNDVLRWATSPQLPCLKHLEVGVKAPPSIVGYHGCLDHVAAMPVLRLHRDVLCRRLPRLVLDGVHVHADSLAGAFLDGRLGALVMCCCVLNGSFFRGRLVSTETVDESSEALCDVFFHVQQDGMILRQLHDHGIAGRGRV
jgi:hypothetical protein